MKELLDFIILAILYIFIFYKKWKVKGKDVKLSISDIKFNDKLIYDYSWSRDDIINGKKGILEMNLSFLANEDEAKDIDMVRTVSFTVGILDSNFQTVASQEITYEINSPIAITSND